ncbi:50S ribosomal protein L18 [bacterium CG2_30_37_16]|nr:MAG: 50S ribosomal protein L18 [bacterium CG2_30_37_16]PIP30721.1 MAG: 50S ribosomal protein L18 [bacterium (Candidatus Howlettbacteria) CG23_combo_of_CG06-09_8_20_14_all_37_9]PIX99259.1 MAG: 50S ribosomal protein L18 [bacterium (Candidatus Howlettbacteria) CG_4_10_14_3_um_filter_37_10]PJB05576.1 MAG: 50S ribosomal protein L18 [bacterium (Candidatus Howlettbacteria) CG_4_9_14_3_um_filter_37_10]
MNKRESYLRRKKRIRQKISGSAKRPRLSVYTSNNHVIAQLIDDTKGNTIAYATDINIKNTKGTKTQIAALVGTQIAALAKTKKIDEVVFDRGGRLYHGRVKALAEAAREVGLKF